MADLQTGNQNRYIPADRLTLTCQGWRPSMTPATSPPRWDASNFPQEPLHLSCCFCAHAGRRRWLLMGRRIGRLRPHVLCCHIVYSQIESRAVWHGYYFRGNTLKCHRMHRWFLVPCFDARKSFQNWTAWHLNCGCQNDAAKTLWWLHFLARLLSDETMQ